MALDSILHQRLYSRAELESMLLEYGKTAPLLLPRADSRTESALESIVRQRLRAAGLRPRLQVKVPGLGRVDLMIGRLVIEVDGREYHTQDGSFEEDRRRDRVAASLGLVVIRITWHQVIAQWDEVLADVLSALRTRGLRR